MGIIYQTEESGFVEAITYEYYLITTITITTIIIRFKMHNKAKSLPKLSLEAF